MKSFTILLTLILMMIIPVYSQPLSIDQVTIPRLPVILNVPVPYATIQAAIDAAMEGDTVLVAEGTYYENLQITSKSITLGSHFLIDGDTSHISRTIIDGSQPLNPDLASVIRVRWSTEPTVICGFTITGGYGTHNPVGFRVGGGINAVRSSITISNNQIINNSIIDNDGVDGGGICIYSFEVDSLSIIIRNNVIADNYAEGEMPFGGGIAIHHDSQNTINYLIENNIIRGNIIQNIDEWKAMGGGIGLNFYLPTSGSQIIRNNLITGNEAHCQNSFGGAIYIIISESISGGSIDNDPGPYIYNNIISNNHSDYLGGAVAVWRVYWPLGDDRAWPLTSAGHYTPKPSFINNTILNNTAPDGAGFYIMNHIPFSMNNILWNDYPSNAPWGEIFLGDDSTWTAWVEPNTYGDAEVYNTDVQGGWSAGAGNINAVPLLADTLLFQLSDESPCIGAGRDNILMTGLPHYAPTTDFHGHPRPQPAGSMPDIGAAENPRAFPDRITLREVPNDYPTIQEAIDASVEADTVLVAENTYFENINFKGKAITVASHFLMDGDTSHISQTIIDGSQPSHPDSGSVVYFTTGGDTTSVLCGFTITGGNGTLHGSNSRSGGGIACRNSGAKIIHNIIRNNHVISATPATPGGGISGGPLNDNSWIVIQNNTIKYNSVTNTANDGEALGGGISLVQNARVINNIIEFNIAHSNDGAAIGGGTALICTQERDRYIIGNKILYNKALSPTGTYIDGGLGGGLAVGDLPRAEIRLNDIRYNEVEGNVSLNINSWGGGVVLVNQNEETIFAQNLVADNKVLNNSNCYGAGIASWNADVTGGPQIINNIIIQNSRATWGGGLFIGGLVNNTTTLINNTICNDTATSGGALYVGYDDAHPSHVVILNSILWNNSSNISVNSGSHVDTVYSDIEGGYQGNGNINSDPFLYDSLLAPDDTMFCCLAANSPCIDVGNPDSSSYDVEDLQNPGYALWPARGTLRNDMGAYGGHGRTDIIVGINKRTDATQISQTYQLYQNHPNPFNPVTTIEFSLPQAGFVTLKVYNLLGEEVCTLLSAFLLSGFHSYQFEASDFASGVYYYRLEAGSYTEVKKMLLLK